MLIPELYHEIHSI